MRRKPNRALIETAIPARLDRLRWGRFHTLVVVALGIAWLLDGLEGTLAGAVAGALKATNAEVGLASSFYLAGAVLGALLFGWLTDRLGRKRFFLITLTVYLLATASTVQGRLRATIGDRAPNERIRRRKLGSHFGMLGAC